MRRGDRMIVMLGNQVELWETSLAAMKLGAVVIPATPLLGASDLVDRVQRGEARHVIAASGSAAKFDDVPGDYTRIAVGEPVEGWLPFDDARSASSAFAPDGVTKASDTLLLYFTSGTTSQPKLVEHSHVSYPVGHLSTMYWLGLQPGRRAPQHLLAGLGEARVEQRLRAVERRGHRARLQLHALRGRTAPGPDVALRGDDLLRPADGLADARSGGPRALGDPAARDRLAPESR